MRFVGLAECRWLTLRSRKRRRIIKYYMCADIDISRETITMPTPVNSENWLDRAELSEGIPEGVLDRDVVGTGDACSVDIGGSACLKMYDSYA